MVVLSLGLASCGGDAKAAAGDGADGCGSCESCGGCDSMTLDDVTPAPSDAEAAKTDVPKKPEEGK